MSTHSDSEEQMDTKNALLPEKASDVEKMDSRNDSCSNGEERTSAVNKKDSPKNSCSPGDEITSEVDKNDSPKDSCSTKEEMTSEVYKIDSPKDICSTKDEITSEVDKTDSPKDSCSPGDEITSEVDKTDSPKDSCSTKDEITLEVDKTDSPNDSCSTKKERTYHSDDAEPCLDGGNSDVEPCTSQSNSAGSSTTTPDGETELVPIFEDLTLNDTPRPDPLYRVVRHDEDPNIGLIAKDRKAKKTVISHVNCGSRKYYESQYISLTKSPGVAQKWHATSPGSKIGVIDVDEFPPGTEVTDLTTEENRDRHLKNSKRIKNYAKKSQEVLLVNESESIPFTLLEE
uniref:Uncharacterized protein n=1 Tax=Clytia hemisphaerica TaxID=252671 RepID=A0A7M5V7P6_9CNID